MTDQPSSQESPDEHEGEAPAAEPPLAVPPPPAAAPATAYADASDLGGSRPASERPELAAGAAFAGGLVLALILKRLAR